MKKLNIRELAKSLGLSASTVSKALKDSYEISNATKQKVLEAAERLDYTPNPYASSLRKKRSKTIAVIMPEVADNFFSLAINGIQSIAKTKGYHVLIYLSHDKFEHEKMIVEDCRSGRVDGVLISISGETTSAEHCLKLRSEKIPVVFFDRELENLDIPKVITNDYDCGNTATRHLLERGCKNPVFLSLSSSLSICAKRAKGFAAALCETGINPERKIIACDGNEDAVIAEIKKLLLSSHRPDGFVASVERLAFQVYIASEEIGIKIPDDIKIVAFSTVETAPILNPSLTTITQPAFQMGRAAAELLFRNIEKPYLDLSRERIELPSKLIIRNSSGGNRVIN
ncbi:LacI family DNA-binding transcriptional regulator [Parafilimonas sp.]|uniref:LacI family DNA-binding transcriptional regulator n=1 Tax=Parafilimonas sp. TaxID=1969739 RepID=UPI0039E2460E